MTRSPAAPLSGLAVLLVEDEYLVALDAEEILKGLGVGNIRVASNYQEALHCVEHESFDVAILDVNLNGTHSFPLCEILIRRQKPYLFASGYNLDKRQEAGPAYVAKPYDRESLKRALVNTLEQAAAPR
jgi:CheY-like chemotaxis protein